MSDPIQPDTLRARAARIAYEVQEAITTKIEEVDGPGRFREDSWRRLGGGGGRSRVLAGGGVFEKAGVNVSEVEGELSEAFAASLPGKGRKFFATGVSLVFHPSSPRIPTVHANFRYIEKGDSWWFGGGADLTPYTLREDDAVHFHTVWKAACDRHDPSYYPRFKKWCDEYFFLAHRGEARGIGGIFFDELSGDPERLLAFWKDCAGAFLEAYVPIVERRRDEPFTEADRTWQLLRRGRYVEFNLLYDRGTVFGLKTGGRIESILMSLPPLARWEYDAPEPAGGPEAELLRVLRQPRDWIDIAPPRRRIEERRP